MEGRGPSVSAAEGVVEVEPIACFGELEWRGDEVMGDVRGAASNEARERKVPLEVWC